MRREGKLQLGELVRRGYDKCPAAAEGLLVFEYEGDMLVGQGGDCAGHLADEPFAAGAGAVSGDVEDVMGGSADGAAGFPREADPVEL